MDSQKALLKIILGLMVIIGEGRAPVLHRVGGDRFGWRLNVNFSNWSSHDHFYVGDWLYFGFDKHKLSVLEVNKTGYEKCRESNFKSNITRGGRDVFNLTVARPYYFISGGGYCINGVRIAINVQDSPPDSATPVDSLIKSFNNTTTSSAISIIMDSFLITIIMALLACTVIFYY